MIDDPGNIKEADTRCTGKPNLRSDIAWNPTPIDKPAVHRSLPHLPWPQRVGGVLTYSMARMEYWISPSGILREWLRLVVKISLYLAIPAFLLVPIITLLLMEAVSFTEAISQIAVNVLRTLAAIFVAGVICFIALALVNQVRS